LIEQGEAREDTEEKGNARPDLRLLRSPAGKRGDAGGEPPAFLHLRALRIFSQREDEDEMATRNRNAAAAAGAAPRPHHHNRGEPMDIS